MKIIIMIVYGQKNIYKMLLIFNKFYIKYNYIIYFI